jgi:hypothetical protein
MLPRPVLEHLAADLRRELDRTRAPSARRTLTVLLRRREAQLVAMGGPWARA